MSPLKTVVCFIVSSLGCILQVYHISDQFFDYTTTTRVSIGRQTSSFVPTLVFCTNMTSLMEPPVDDWYQFAQSTPFNEWFDRTYPRLNIVDSGYYFGDGVNYRLSFNQSQFRSMFQVGKLIKRRDVCYSLSYKDPFEFNYRAATSTSGDPILVAFIFSPNFLRRETSVNFFIHSYESTFHGISNSLAAERFSRVGNGSLALYKIILTYAEYDSFLLSSPYDTHCHDYRPKYRSERHCYDECHLNLSLEIQGMIPMSVIKERRFNAMVYPSASALSPKQRTELTQIKSNCTVRCQKVQCNSDDFVPILIHSIPSQRVEVVLQASPDPLFKTISQPKINLIDFVTYIVSCIGFWFGISCFHFTEKCLQFRRSTTSQFSIPVRLQGRDTLLKNRTSHFLLNRSIQIRLRRLEEFVAKIS